MSTRILIAEDDDVQSAVLLAAITKRGYEAEVVTDGLEAVRRLRTGRYDLALLDYALPEVDGLSAARLMQDLLGEARRPRMIAVTASAEQLQAKELVAGGTSFDAVVSKAQGLSALLAVVEENVALSAKLQAATTLLRERQQADEAQARLRRRLLAPLAALPAATMMAAFAIAFFWTANSVGVLRSSIAQANQTVALGTDAGALIDAMHEAETSQRTYLATGLDGSRNLFQADAERVDRLLTEPSSIQQPSLAAPGTALPYPVIQSWLATLGQEVLAQPKPGSTIPDVEPSLSQARETAMELRQWADTLVDQSQRIVLAGLKALDRNVQAVLVVLAAGMLYSLWHAVRAARRQYASADMPAPPSWLPFQRGPAAVGMGYLASTPIRRSLAYSNQAPPDQPRIGPSSP